MFIRQKLLKHGYMDSVTDIILFIVCKIYFNFFWWSMEGNNKYAGKSITSAMEYVDLATYTFATWQIRSYLLYKFISPGACPLSFPSISRSFRQENRIAELFYWSKFRDRKENEIFVSQAKNMQGLRHW